MKEMQKPYFLEPLLPLRVKKYMETHSCVDLEDMTDYLIGNYKDFQNKRKKLFIKSVAKAYKWELHLDNERSGENLKESDVKKLDDFYVIDKGERPDIVEIPKKKPSSFSIDSMYRTSSATIKGVNLAKADANEAKKLSMKRKQVTDSLDTQIENIVIKRKKYKATTPELSLQDMKGIRALCTNSYLLSLNLMEDYLKASAPKSVLLSGPQGSGKTMYAMGLAGDLNATLMRVSVLDLMGGGGLDIDGTMKELMKEAVSLCPCVVLLENLDCLSKEFGVSKGFDRRILEQLMSTLNDLETKYASKQILIMAETRAPQNIDLFLRSKFRMDIFMPVLDKESRVAILKALCSDTNRDLNWEEIALRTTSFVAGDLKNLVEKARRAAWERVIKESLGKNLFEVPKLKQFVNSYSSFSKNRTLDIQSRDFTVALSIVTPTLKREGFPSVPETTWEDVGGLEDIKEELSEKILMPMKYGELHEKFRAKKPNGILLWGPPGCGKTLLAKAVANHAGVSLYAVMGPELLNMYQGESERAIREVFKRAENVAPCVIFFDEFDCICPRRSVSADSGSKMTIVNTLLVEMNGFNQRKDVYVMAATNRPDMVDPAVLRPGRFDTSLYVGLPDDQCRIAVLNACTRNGTEPKLAADVDFDEIGTWCQNFSGADCAQLVYMASKGAIAEEIRQGSYLNNKEKVGTLYKRHFEVAIKRVSPSVAPEEQKKYLRMKTKFDNWKKNGKEILLQDELDS